MSDKNLDTTIKIERVSAKSIDELSDKLKSYIENGNNIMMIESIVVTYKTKSC